MKFITRIDNKFSQTFKIQLLHDLRSTFLSNPAQFFELCQIFLNYDISDETLKFFIAYNNKILMKITTFNIKNKNI